jgi:hypothetical protein
MEIDKIANEMGANEMGANEMGANEMGANEMGANETSVTDMASEIGMIMRQTNYDETTAREKLAEHKDVMKVIREYLNGGKLNEPVAAKLSTNQQIYKEIRGMMDDAAKTYLEKRDAATQ